jgi:hypothetical protein
VPTLRIAQDPAADELLSRDPLALLIGMLPDQPMCRRSSDLRPRSCSGSTTSEDEVLDVLS